MQQRKYEIQYSKCLKHNRYLIKHEINTKSKSIMKQNKRQFKSRSNTVKGKSMCWRANQRVPCDNISIVSKITNTCQRPPISPMWGFVWGPLWCENNRNKIHKNFCTWKSISKHKPKTVNQNSTPKNDRNEKTTHKQSRHTIRNIRRKMIRTGNQKPTKALTS